jgi:hypothetical protein
MVNVRNSFIKLVTVVGEFLAALQCKRHVPSADTYYVNHEGCYA